MQDLVFNCGEPEVRSDKSNEGRSLGHTCPTQNPSVILKYQAFRSLLIVCVQNLTSWEIWLKWLCKIFYALK